MNPQPAFHRVAIAASVLALAACTTVGPDYKIPQGAAINRNEAAASFAAATGNSFSQDALPAQWWRLYHDAALDKLIDKAFAANTGLRVAAANLERSHAVLDEAGDATRPKVGISVEPGYGRPSGAALALPEALPNGGMYDLGANVSYQVDLFGKIHRAIEAASADSEAAQAAFDLAHVTVAADTARAYVGACAAGEQLRVAQHSIGLQQQFVDVTARRQRAGRSTALELSRARSQLEQLRAAVPPLQAQQRVALYRLAVLTGEVPGKGMDNIAQCMTMPRLSSPIPVGDGTALLRRRPDIRQAERTLASATARIGVATADLYPNVTLGASIGSTGVLEDFGAANATRWSIGPLISWTLPNTGSARTRIKQAEAGSNAALARFDGVVLNALRETESALTVYARELDRNTSLQAARDQSALASQQARKLHAFGRADFLTTLDADRTLANAESALAASNAQLASDQVGVFLALGGGWETE
jgi:multidrug efflux system outer membrane protein